MGRLLLVATLLLVPAALAAQAADTTGDTARVLILERQFGPDSAAPVNITLRQHVIYLAVVAGPGTPAAVPVRRHGREAFISPESPGAAGQPQRFEVYPLETGPHLLSLTGVPPGVAVTLRLYVAVSLTRQVAARRVRTLSFGFQLGAGGHTGYRLDPTGGASPTGGSDFEGCFLAQQGDRFGTCLGVGRQNFPDARYFVTWLFAEEQVRLASVHLVGNRRTDLGVNLRYGTGLSAGPRHLTPALLSGGIYVVQHLEADGRWGWSVYAGWQHCRLGFAPETERLDSDRFLAGVEWVR